MVRILVTAGPTREHLDDVRYLSNGSSGRMGYAIAAAAAQAGHPVLLVSGPVERKPPAGVECVAVVSGLEMQAAAEEAFPSCGIAFGVAAVCDYRPARRRSGKPHKEAGPLTLELVANPDIIAGLAAHKGYRVVVGFALEAPDPRAEDPLAAALERGRAKLAAKNLDLIAVNLIEALGASSSQVVLLAADGSPRDLPRQDKEATAAVLVEVATRLWQDRQAPETGSETTA